MPANLHPEAQIKWLEYQEAKGLDERIAKLEAFLSSVNKHKGNEKLIAVNKTKLAKLKEERDLQAQRQKSMQGAKEDPFSIKREPQSVQIIMISDFFEHGNGVGKTTLLKNMTGVSEGKVGQLTEQPVVGIHIWNQVKFQIVEQPALHDWQFLLRQLASLRTTDLVAIVIDLSKDPLQQMENVLKILRENHIVLNREPPKVQIERTGSGGVQLFFLTKAAKDAEPLSDFIKEMVEAYGLKNATIKLFENVNVDELELAFNRSSAYKPAIIFATKGDLPGSSENFQLLHEKYGISKELPDQTPDPTHFPIYPVAIKYDENGKEIRQGMTSFEEDALKRLNLIRIFTKSKKGVANKPLILPKESTIGDVALKIHKDLYETFKFASVYRNSENSSLKTKIRAGINFQVQEFDVIEIFSRV
jgi:hypothetical protein